MWSLFILTLFGLISWSNSAKCPAEYERFSLEHTFCISKNPRCDIKRSGVSQQDIQEILRLHNQYRSDLALGKETRAKGGTLPKAADMLQMVWDDELAAIAQKWAENCEFDHDCDECRDVPNFGVGQNLAIQYASCSNCKEDDITKPKWADAVKDLYDEVLDFHKSWLDRFESHGGPDVEHFTQIIWSKTWRLGCGYTAYKTGKTYNRFYVCNYGPSGNVNEQPVYKQGNPCSACPSNTCCGSACKSGPNYPGLCKLLNPNTAPVYQRNLNNLLFFCDSNPKAKDCETQITGANKWTNKASLEGNYMSIVLNGGESTTLQFKKPIAPTKNEFCIRFNFRKGPMKADQGDASILKAEYKLDRGSTIPMNLHNSGNVFENYSIDLAWKTKTTKGLILQE
ncbi:CRISP/Allergen/PR-1 like protein [Argiope bruennichi]|uniref:CRISP/Allergen/PR-1 like protein n=1 Tax=Argiope bruennichi TaxID=94029 RepID=A0A8T0E3G1_ARGBR|nr:CRISP/Allergen/PR-1 like protein [Argiope bruennichi]